MGFPFTIMKGSEYKNVYFLKHMCTKSDKYTIKNRTVAFQYDFYTSSRFPLKISIFYLYQSTGSYLVHNPFGIAVNNVHKI